MLTAQPPSDTHGWVHLLQRPLEKNVPSLTRHQSVGFLLCKLSATQCPWKPPEPPSIICSLQMGTWGEEKDGPRHAVSRGLRAGSLLCLRICRVSTAPLSHVASSGSCGWFRVSSLRTWTSACTRVPLSVAVPWLSLCGTQRSLSTFTDLVLFYTIKLLAVSWGRSTGSCEVERKTLTTSEMLLVDFGILIQTCRLCFSCSFDGSVDLF